MLLNKKLTEYNRYQAFAVHLAISLIIFLTLLICITQYWYPGLLFDAGNGWQVIGILVGIDLILGPLLTLIIFNAKKKSLKLDLSIIGLVQVAALAYGTWVINLSHPIAIVYIDSSFHIIHASAPFANDIKKTAQENGNQLYYLIDNENLSSKLKSEQFYPYTQYQSIVLKKHLSDDGKNPLVHIERLGEPYGIELDTKSGKILSVMPFKGSN